MCRRENSLDLDVVHWRAGMLRRIILLTVVFGLTLPIGVASATAFKIDLDASSVTLTDQSGGGLACHFTSCGIEAQLAPDFGGEITLDAGETWEFDFIEFTAHGTTGFFGRSFGITATLAFEEPLGIDTTSTGGGRGFFIAGVITGGVLTWEDVPQTYTLSDGSQVVVNYQSGVSILPLSKSVITTASVSLGSGAAPVPEPSAALLFGAGILLASRRQFLA